MQFNDNFRIRLFLNYRIQPIRRCSGIRGVAEGVIGCGSLEVDALSTHRCARRPLAQLHPTSMEIKSVKHRLSIFFEPRLW